jgi:NADPH:quinone reductase-like Zn-dependent oxidoreductase
VSLIEYNGARGRAAYAKLDQLIAAGPFDVHVSRVFTLAQLAEAHHALAGHVIGKLALRLR